MVSRADLHRQFAARFHAGKRLRPATEDQVLAAESALGLLWPSAYRQFALSWGAVYAPSLSSIIAQRKLRLSAVEQFLTPKQSVTETKRWQLEPIGTCLAIASDCSGNWFAFRNLQGQRIDDAEVWLFDHELDSVAVEAATFDSWLERFVSL